jgi:hypothetical protein
MEGLSLCRRGFALVGQEAILKSGRTSVLTGKLRWHYPVVFEWCTQRLLAYFLPLLGPVGGGPKREELSLVEQPTPPPGQLALAVR